MKKIFNKILNSRILLSIIILIGLFLLIRWGVSKYQDLKVDLRISSQNESALKDSLRVTKNKIGNLEYSKQILVAKNASDLKALNEDLAKINKNFAGKIHELTKILAKIDNKTTVINNTTLIDLPDNVQGFKWSFDKQYDNENSRSLAGITKFKYNKDANIFTPLETLITKDEINFNIIQGLRTRSDGKVEMFASSDYPNFSVSELNSVIIDPSTHPALKQFSKKKKFGISLYSGLGATLNLSNSNIIFGPQIGLGISYNLW